MPIFTYGINKRKENDLAFRQAVMSEISKARTNMNNLLDVLYEGGNTKALDALRKSLSELDVFSNEVDLSQSGHAYPFFSKQKSVDKKNIDKLIKLDVHIYERMQNVTTACRKIANMAVDKKSVNMPREILKIRQYITDARNKYKDRIEYIKGLK